MFAPLINSSISCAPPGWYGVRIGVTSNRDAACTRSILGGTYEPRGCHGAPSRVLHCRRHAEAECPELYSTHGRSRVAGGAPASAVLLHPDTSSDGQVKSDGPHRKPVGRERYR